MDNPGTAANPLRAAVNTGMKSRLVTLILFYYWPAWRRFLTVTVLKR